jgi:hypothetical protein
MDFFAASLDGSGKKRYEEKTAAREVFPEAWRII